MGNYFSNDNIDHAAAAVDPAHEISEMDVSTNKSMDESTRREDVSTTNKSADVPDDVAGDEMDVSQQAVVVQQGGGKSSSGGRVVLVGDKVMYKADTSDEGSLYTVMAVIESSPRPTFSLKNEEGHTVECGNLDQLVVLPNDQLDTTATAPNQGKASSTSPIIKPSAAFLVKPPAQRGQSFSQVNSPGGGTAENAKDEKVLRCGKAKEGQPQKLGQFKTEGSNQTRKKRTRIFQHNSFEKKRKTDSNVHDKKTRLRSISSDLTLV